MKTIKHFLLTLAVLLCSISASAHDFAVGGIYYNITSKADKTVAVTYRGNSSNSYSNEYSGSVTIPESVTYNGTTYSVTSIGGGAFQNCTGLTSVTIGNSVTSIGNYAFRDCSGLTSVTIPNSVTSIGDYAFQNCSGLTSVTIPNSVTSIGNYAFDGTPWYNAKPDGLVYINNVLYKYKGTMPSGTAIEIKEGTISISSFAFNTCDGLTSVTIPNSVTSIGKAAFYGCKKLTSVTIPNSVTSIGDYVFYNCTGLTSVTIPNSVESIGTTAFGRCSGLTSIVIPNSVTRIGTEAFWGCSGLTSVTIPNSVESIGYYAFQNCTGLTSVTIGDGVKSIDDEAFSGCSGLTSVTIGDSVTDFGYRVFDNTLWYEKQPDGVIYINNILYGYKGDMPDNTSIVIKDGTICIAESAFDDCDGLISVTIPNSITSIGNGAFYQCSGLTSVTIPNSVESIGYYAFEYCTGLTSVTIGNSVTSIRQWAFFGCSGLTDVYCLAPSVPEAFNSFPVSNIGNATLHVPAESVEAYAAAEPWSGFGAIVALPAEEVEITIGSTGATTFCSEYALDFTDAECVKAYAATGYNTETGVVTLTRVKTAKAGTGLFVVGDEGTYSIPIIDASADNSLNMLVGTTEEVTIPTADGTYTNYIYGKSDDNTGFFKLTGDKVIPAGKAYLQIPTAWLPAVAESKIKIEFEDGTTTGIDDIEEQVRPNDGVIYDLHGRVVKNPGKGIYIVNGKKVLF